MTILELLATSKISHSMFFDFKLLVKNQKLVLCEDIILN